MPSNDNNPAMQGMTPQLPDPHGQAALLLVESLIHGLVERSILSTADAIDIIDSADSVQVDIAEAADGHGAPMWRAHALLTSIAVSLRHDEDGGPKTPHPSP